MPMMTLMVIEMIALALIALWVNLYHLWPDVRRVGIRTVQILVRGATTAARPVNQHKYHYANRRH